MEKTKYSLSTIRKKAYAAGYRVEKGFQHYNNGAVCRDCNGDARILVIMCGIYQVAISFGEVVALITTMTILQRWKMSKNF